MCFAGGEWGKVRFESKYQRKSQEQTSQAINSKKVCEQYLLHQTGMQFSKCQVGQLYLGGFSKRLTSTN